MPELIAAAEGPSEAVVEEHRGEFMVSSDLARMDMNVVHGYLSRAYWCEGLPRETLEQAMRNSLCFGLFEGQNQIGFARVVSDRTTFAYVCDVFCAAVPPRQRPWSLVDAMRCQASRAAGVTTLALNHPRCALALSQGRFYAVEQTGASHGSVHARHV